MVGQWLEPRPVFGSTIIPRPGVMRAQQLCAIGIHEDIVEDRPSIFVQTQSVVIVPTLPV